MKKKLLITLGVSAGVIIILLLLHFGMSRLLPIIQHLHDGGG